MLPDASTALPDTSKDCFARDKFADYRDDMGGVGSFQRQNRTLYIGRIKETGTGVETEEVVRRHFREWGEIEKSASTSTAYLSLLADCFILTSFSPCPPVPQRRVRDICLRAQCAIRQRGYGMSVTRQRRDPQRPLGD